MFMKRLIFWIQKKKRIEKRSCSQCCLGCPYFNECLKDGEF